MTTGNYHIPDGYTLFSKDLNYVLLSKSIDWQLLDKKRILITGGSGFFGRWLIEVLLWVIKSLNINLHIIVLTRNIEKFYRNVPISTNLTFKKNIQLIESDLCTINAEKFNNIDYIFHLASDSSPAKGVDWARNHFISSIIGVKNILEIAKSNSCSAVITSSGAIYNSIDSFFNNGYVEQFSSSKEYLAENNIYQISKRNIEAISSYYNEKYGTRVLLCRCFAFAGPYLPLDANYAFGNFIGSALMNRNICINGDGKAVRSYMYMSDLIIWLLSILQRGSSSRPYNVGSPHSVSIGELALRVKNLCNSDIEIITNGGNFPNSIYFPSIERASEDLSLAIGVNLNDAILNTFNWYKKRC
jgi:dTDP-glucose 4,6-dehydratase